MDQHNIHLNGEREDRPRNGILARISPRDDNKLCINFDGPEQTPRRLHSVIGRRDNDEVYATRRGDRTDRMDENRLPGKFTKGLGCTRP